MLVFAIYKSLAPKASARVTSTLHNHCRDKRFSSRQLRWGFVALLRGILWSDIFAVAPFLCSSLLLADLTLSVIKLKSPWMNDWDARRLWLQPTIFCTGITGESWFQTNSLRSQMPLLKQTGKIFSETLALIDRQMPDSGSMRVMLQDEARFGRIADTRRCWCPKPIRPMCKAMVTQETPMLMLRSRYWTGSSTR